MEQNPRVSTVPAIRSLLCWTAVPVAVRYTRLFGALSPRGRGTKIYSPEITSRGDRHGPAESSILSNGGYIMSDIIQALEPAAAILLGVVALTGIVAWVAVKRGDAALSKHHH